MRLRNLSVARTFLLPFIAYSLLAVNINAAAVNSPDDALPVGLRNFVIDERSGSILKNISDQRLDIVFNVLDRLDQALKTHIDSKDARAYVWRVTIADEDQRVFRDFGNSSRPPEALRWDGRNEQNEWVRPGRSYSVIYEFTDPGGASFSVYGEPISPGGVVTEEDVGMVIRLDISRIFGKDHASSEILPVAFDALLRPAAFLIRHRSNGGQLGIRIFGRDAGAGFGQGQALHSFLAKELGDIAKNVNVDANPSAFADQRIEFIVFNGKEPRFSATSLPSAGCVFRTKPRAISE